MKKYGVSGGGFPLGLFWLLWTFGLLLSLGTLGVIIWAVIRLVIRYT